MINKKLHRAFYFILLLIMFFSIFIAYMLLLFTKTDITTSEYTFNVNRASNISIKIPPFKTSDRIYIVFNTSSRVELGSATPLKQLPYDVEGLPFEFEDWLLLQQRFCFIATQTLSNFSMQVNFIDPEFPYVVKVFEGEVNYTLFEHIDIYQTRYAGISLKASTNQTSRFQQIILIYPYHKTAEQNFQIEGSIRLFSGKINNIILLLITRDRGWFPYLIVPRQEIRLSKAIDFSVNLYNQTIYGHTLSEDFAKRIWYIAMTIGLDSEQWKGERKAYANIGVSEIKIQNGMETITVQPKVSSEYAVNCKVYVFHKFHPTSTYTISIILLTVLFIIGALILARITNSTSFPQKLLKSLVTVEVVSDPRPNTYLAKLFHKPRYDRLMILLSQFAGKKISTLIDVGCGLGVLNEYLKNSNFIIDLYVGCDINKEIIKNAKNIQRVVCDVNRLPFKQNIAEVVVCSEVLEHIQNPNLGFKELLRVSGKWLFISFPDERVKNALGFRYSEHISEPNAKEFKRLAEKEKFKLLKMDKEYFAFPPSVFDKLGLSYKDPFNKIITFAFKLLSAITRNLSLIKTVIMVFKRVN